MCTILASSYPSFDNQLETSSNPMYQDAMKERQTLSFMENSSKSNDDMARKYTHSNTVQHAECFKQNIPGAFTVTTNALFQADGVETAVQNFNSSAHQDALILSVIEQLKSQVINCTKINLDNKSVNDTLNAELERYKEQVKVLKEGQHLEPKLYDGNVIKNTSAIVIPDSDKTIMLAEESRSKMLLKQQDPMMLEKKVNTTLVDYAALNQLSQDFEK
uniref:Uncharacterized protein n=1 Tax=Tanacetum cinerariifolium TaxID=118510 RepID=A0A6L2LDL0_TANCI|nr:hypothetical protein [Tanacetum cinerariifolium]